VLQKIESGSFRTGLNSRSPESIPSPLS